MHTSLEASARETDDLAADLEGLPRRDFGLLPGALEEQSLPRVLLFSMRLKLDGDKEAELEYYQGDDPVVVAEAFCYVNALDPETNVPGLVDAINERIPVALQKEAEVAEMDREFQQ